jgi:hypothetical protein
MCVYAVFFSICFEVYSYRDGVGVLPVSGWEGFLIGGGGGGVEAGVQRAGRGGLRLRAPGFGSGRAQLRASAPVWNGHAGRACSRVSPTRLTHYRTLVVSDLQTFPPPYTITL